MFNKYYFGLSTCETTMLIRIVNRVYYLSFTILVLRFSLFTYVEILFSENQRMEKGESLIRKIKLYSLNVLS